MGERLSLILALVIENMYGNQEITELMFFPIFFKFIKDVWK